ncbi:MAG: hypothetical protein JO016_17055 [Actinobacteria bacterium]|nr:hypothetical protein [Actinomycetota bacterium]
MRRPTDRIESILRLALITLLVAGVPVTAVATGLIADRLIGQHARAERSNELIVSAVLTKKAEADGDTDPYSDFPVAWVDARWTAPDGSVHRGQILARSGARAGSTAPVWIYRSGGLANPPMTRGQIRVNVALAIMTAAELLPMLLIGLFFLSRHFLDVRRMEAWDAEWCAVGPQWSRHQA